MKVFIINQARYKQYKIYKNKIFWAIYKYMIIYQHMEI